MRSRGTSEPPPANSADDYKDGTDRPRPRPGPLTLGRGIVDDCLQGLRVDVGDGSRLRVDPPRAADAAQAGARALTPKLLVRCWAMQWHGTSKDGWADDH